MRFEFLISDLDALGQSIKVFGRGRHPARAPDKRPHLHAEKRVGARTPRSWPQSRPRLCRRTAAKGKQTKRLCEILERGNSRTFDVFRKRIVTQSYACAGTLWVTVKNVRQSLAALRRTVLMNDVSSSRQRSTSGNGGAVDGGRVRVSVYDTRVSNYLSKARLIELHEQIDPGKPVTCARAAFQLVVGADDVPATIGSVR